MRSENDSETMKNLKISERNTGFYAAGLSFLAAWGFFQFVYPYHLMRREQLNLFLYDWDYIKETYTGIGWLSRMAGDFIDQFLYFPVIGPILIALILTALAAVTYGICRHWLKKWPSMGIAALVFVWSFMRETENLFLTQYSIATLTYLSLILAALSFRRIWAKSLAAVCFVAFGVFAAGKPFDNDYGRLWGTPNFLNEKIIGMDVFNSRYNWDKVLKLAEDNLYVNSASYNYNLASAMKETMGDDHFKRPQNYANSLFLWIGNGSSQFSDGEAGEVWFHLGNMTMAEQSAIVALQRSPKHTGTRFLKRMAEITLISGEDEAAQKYLNMLSRTLAFRKWAKDMTPGSQSEEARKWLKEARSRLVREDSVYWSTLEFRDVLRRLLAANPDNMTARQYLLVYDLMMLDLESFISDYKEKMIPGDIYEQAALIWLSMNRNEDEAEKYGVSRQTVQKMQSFFRYPDKYPDTYWYYYMNETS